MTTAASNAHSFQPIFDNAQRSFVSCIQSFAIFNIVFIALCAIQVFLFFLFFNLLSYASLIAIMLATLLVTSFTYFILRIYFQEKKPLKILLTVEDFFNEIKNNIGFQEGNFEHHLTLAHSACRLTNLIQDLEYTFYIPPDWLNALQPTLEKFSCWWHFKDVHLFRQHLLQAAVQEHLALIKIEPTNLQLHASLANTYVMLSGLYADPNKGDPADEEHWIHPLRTSEETREKFLNTASKAIEEFKILNDFAPNDPWVHAQLALSFRDLQMPEEEIKEYEILLKLKPKDSDTLFKLGELYFKIGQNSQGLRVYQELKAISLLRASTLIKSYGSSDYL